jgi:aspartate-semialdehyde dehydrogenase
MIKKVPPYRICIVGATGAVGQTFIKCLEESHFPVSNLALFASERSAGRKLTFKHEEIGVRVLKKDALLDFDFAFFSAGATISKEYVPIAVSNGIVVIDNSPAFRMKKDVPLVIPEVNPQEIKRHKGIIANPNCATIQLALVLKPIHTLAKIKKIFVSTYQAVSGAGGRAIQELFISSKAYLENKKVTPAIFPRQIAFNIIPQIPQKDAFLEDGYTYEEKKIMEETKKILNDYAIKISATCVRVPVFNGHCESVYIETEKKLEQMDVIGLLKNAPGVKIMGDYPTPVDISGKNEVFVGRIREDKVFEKGLSMWIAADNLLKGAALNAIQIADLLHHQFT